MTQSDSNWSNRPTNQTHGLWAFDFAPSLRIRIWVKTKSTNVKGYASNSPSKPLKKPRKWKRPSWSIPNTAAPIFKPTIKCLHKRKSTGSSLSRPGLIYTLLRKYCWCAKKRSFFFQRAQSLSFGLPSSKFISSDVLTQVYLVSLEYKWKSERAAEVWHLHQKSCFQQRLSAHPH